MHITAPSSHLRNDLYCVEWEVKLYIHTYFLLFGLFMLLYVFPSPTQYIVHTPTARYSLFVLKVPLNTKQTKPYTSSDCFFTTAAVSAWALLVLMAICTWCMSVSTGLMNEGAWALLMLMAICTWCMSVSTGLMNE